MKGQDQNATEPARHRAQSAKMHKQHQTQNPSSQSEAEPSIRRARRRNSGDGARRRRRRCPISFRDGVRIAAWRAGRGE
jgi:hypothetical protein